MNLRSVIRKAILPPAVALCLSLPLPSGTQAQGDTDKLVTSDWLAANLANENIRIIDTRMDIREYWQGHIPGAVYLDTDLLRWPDHGVPGKLLSIDALALLLGQMGNGENTAVVVYYDKKGIQ